MKPLEQKAEEYAEVAFAKALKAPWPEAKKGFADAYIAGATEALASQWRDPKEKLPEDEEYVLIDGPMGIEPAVWNEHYECWDDAEGDDNMYDKNVVKLWMPIPEPPQPESK